MRIRVPALATLLAALVLVLAGAGGTAAVTTASDLSEADAGAAAPAEAATARPIVSDGNGTTNRLALPAADVQTDRVGNVSLDVAGAVGADVDATAGRIATLRIDEAVRAAETADARRAVLGRAESRLGERIDRLRERERAALAAYNAGDISTRTYLARLARIHAGADRLRPAIDQLSQHADTVSDPPVTDQDVAELRARLLPLHGPVRGQATEALRGDRDRLRTYVSTSDSGVVIATVTGIERNRYVRSAYLPSARQPDQPDQFQQAEDHPFTVARDRAAVLYPWAFDNRLSLSIGDPVLFRAAVYPVVIDHPQGVSRTGDLVTYLDGGTTDAFLEHQYKRVTAIPTTALGTNETESLRLAVERTHAGGPLVVQTTTPNGTAVPATVTVDGVAVGTTGVDGTLRTIVASGTVTVNATAAGETATVTGTVPDGTVTTG